jgi:hypothetical protein
MNIGIVFLRFATGTAGAEFIPPATTNRSMEASDMGSSLITPKWAFPIWLAVMVGFIAFVMIGGTLFPEWVMASVLVCGN